MSAELKAVVAECDAEFRARAPRASAGGASLAGSTLGARGWAVLLVTAVALGIPIWVALTALAAAARVW